MLCLDSFICATGFPGSTNGAHEWPEVQHLRDSHWNPGGSFVKEIIEKLKEERRKERQKE